VLVLALLMVFIEEVFPTAYPWHSLGADGTFEQSR